MPVIATTTRYHSTEDLRCHLALKMISEATQQGIKVFVVDESSSDVRNALRKEGATVLEDEGSTMGAGRRQALREANACDPDAIIWMEPEKAPLVPYLRSLTAPLLAGWADIVIPHRTEEGFASYPQFQSLLEQSGNEVFLKVSGLRLDVWMGPRVIHPKVLSFFLDYRGEYGDTWESIFVPLLRAKKEGVRFHGVSVEYVHPPEQTAQEERDFGIGISKRLEQFSTLTEALCKEGKVLGYV